MRDLDFLTFTRIYELGSIARAAKSIPMSVQGVSRILRSIEQELGQSLYYNDHGKKVPTKFGDELYIYSKELVKRRDAFLKHIEEMNRETQIIRVSMPISFFTLVAPNFICDFDEAHPRVNIDLDINDEYSCEQQLISGESSLALTVDPTPEYETHHLISEPYGFAIRNDNELSQCSALTLDDLVDQRLLTRNMDNKITNTLVNDFHEKTGAQLSICHYVDTSQITHSLENPLSPIALVTPSVYKRLKLTNTTFVPFENRIWNLGISWMSNKKITESERMFIEYCSKICLML